MAPSVMETRLARLRAAIKDDLEKLPDVPKAEPKPEVKPDPKLEVKAATPAFIGPPRPPPKSQPKSTNPGNIIWPEAQEDGSSDDSEADCDVEFIRVEENKGRIKELEKDASSDEDHGAIPRTLEKVKLAKGQLAPQGQGYVAIVGFSKFPYKYISKEYSEKVADCFFNAGKFWMRDWDLYYVWPLDYSPKPLILVSEEQFIYLIKEINTRFPHLHVDPKDSWYSEVGLTCDFNSFKHPRFLPRFLGRCSSKDQYDNMVDKSPSAEFMRKDDPTPKKAPDDRSREAFRALVENALVANKAKNRQSKEVRRVARVEKQKDMGKQLKRAQRYLGVRPKKEMIEEQAAPAIPAIDYSQPAPYPFENSPVFVCIDVEAYERSNKIITEIGVATLDTLDLIGVPPGVSGKNWQSKIRARHFRIKEHQSYRNGEFVSDAADQFEYGDSEFISLKDAPATIANCFKPPFSSSDGTEAGEGEEKEKRNIIFVAHDVNSDIQFLRQVGYDPLNLSNLLETLDTALLYRAHKRDPNAKSVGNILCDFNFRGWNLHNAGNDAVYTMWIMLATCIREASGRGKNETELERQRKLEEDMRAAEERAREIVLEENAAWVEGVEEDDNDDGGVPVKI
ncbi:hypothetical protein BLS_007620 [Venturia inaequalis]|uniref:Gfd2/YDR514C-like C-terminal domain-containing protein n=1 Tax=Venturia inaequalis TaxID=5025 RepID=A0A8H3YMU1_VENIN|nr:hypothetical protein BLS_007620 [Venturia inaequalis]KAE9984242.1 hypothetical protein EG327_005098 [Venturia inaequalis]RDI84532.1 hypothetical protein Vi05172_g5411 [Venturia inaequalis]